MTDDLPTRFRNQAAELTAAANSLLTATDLSENPQKQIAAVIGKTNATTLLALADVAEYLSRDSVDGTTSDERRRAKSFDGVRRAAANAIATDDWDEFDAAIRSRY